jgi:hypothetical protein
LRQSNKQNTDFDIDLFFLVLDNVTKLNLDAKRLLLQHYSIFVKHHYKRFLALCSEEKKESNYVTQLRMFYDSIVDFIILDS